jgi:hypothetical protein
MVSGINPVRRFPTVSGHYSPTVARRPSGRLTSAFAWIRPLLRAGSATSRWSVPDNTPAPTGIRRSRERNRTRRRFGQWNGGFHHYRAPFRHSTPGAASAITDSCSELLFPDVFSGDASAIPYPPGGTRRTLFGAPPRVDPAFSGPAAAVAAGARGSVAVRPHPKAVAKIVDPAAQLLAFYDFPAKHWVYLKHPTRSSRPSPGCSCGPR